MNHVRNAERSEGYEFETNDCAVHALKQVTGVPYSDAHRWWAEQGRKPRSGSPAKVLPGFERDRMPIYGYRIRAWFRAVYKPDLMTVTQILWHLPRKGRFMIITTTHAFAVVDGTVIDNLYRPQTRSRVYFVWQFEPSSEIEARERNAQ